MAHPSHFLSLYESACLTLMPLSLRQALGRRWPTWLLLYTRYRGAMSGCTDTWAPMPL